MAVQLIEGDDKKRSQKCLQAIMEIAASYDCDIVPDIEIFGGKIFPRITVVPKPRDIKDPR